MYKDFGFTVLFLSLLAWPLAGCATTAAAERLVREDVPACLSPNDSSTYRVDVDMVSLVPDDKPDWLNVGPPREAYGKGSGVVIDRNGLILTNAHVVSEDGWKCKPSITISVKGMDKPVKLDATVVAIDQKMDLAVLKVDRKFPNAVILAESVEILKGMAVYNVGYPYDYGEIVGRGHVMRTRFMDADYPEEYWDTTLAEISDGPGTSGSGIYSARTGKMIGIMMAYSFRVAMPGHPPTVVRVVIPAERVRRFLDAHGIAYGTSPPGTPICPDP